MSLMHTADPAGHVAGLPQAPAAAPGADSEQPVSDPAELARRCGLVFEGSSNAMVVLDDDRRVRCANQAAAALLGLPRHRLVGLRVDDLTPAWLRPCLVEGWAEFLREGSILQRRLLSLTDGSTVQVDYCAIANLLPGRHLAVYLPPPLPGGDERAADGRSERGPLTPRELEVVGLLASGLSGSKIAAELFISPDTVRTHIRNARAKLGARTQAHLIATAARAGLIDL